MGVVAAGTVTLTTLPRLLGRVYWEKITGICRVEHEMGGSSQMFLRDGHLVGCIVYANFKPLGRLLLEEGSIDMDAFEKSIGAVADGKRQGDVLVELGYLSREKLLDALRRQQLANLVTILENAGGRYQVEDEVEIPGWTDDVSLTPQEVLLELLRRPDEATRVTRLLHLLGSGPVTTTKDFGYEWPHFHLTRPEYDAIASLSTPQTVDELTDRVEIGPTRLWTLLAALYCFRLVETAP